MTDRIDRNDELWPPHLGPTEGRNAVHRATGDEEERSL